MNVIHDRTELVNSTLATVGKTLREVVFTAITIVCMSGIVLLNVPFALAGGILFPWMRGINLSVSAAVGFVSLFGVAESTGGCVAREFQGTPRSFQMRFPSCGRC